MAIVTERWDGMRWTLRHRARNGIAVRDKLRQRSLERADERCRSVRRNRVVLAPQGWRQACEPVRRRRWQQSVAHRESTYKPSSHCAGNVGCSPLPCMLVCSFFCTTSHTRPRVQRASGIPCSLVRGRTIAKLGQIVPRERGGTFSRHQPRRRVTPWSRDGGVQPGGCGVLDRPVEPGHDSLVVAGELPNPDRTRPRSIGSLRHHADPWVSCPASIGERTGLNGWHGPMRGCGS